MAELGRNPTITILFGEVGGYRLDIDDQHCLIKYTFWYVFNPTIECTLAMFLYDDYDGLCKPNDDPMTATAQ